MKEGLDSFCLAVKGSVSFLGTNVEGSIQEAAKEGPAPEENQGLRATLNTQELLQSCFFFFLNFSVHGDHTDIFQT